MLTLCNAIEYSVLAGTKVPSALPLPLVCQGFNVIANSYDAFGGICATVLQSLSDDYPKQPSILFSVRPPAAVLSQWHTPGRTPGPEAVPRQQAMLQLSSALSLASNLPLAHPLVPLGRSTLSGEPISL